MQRRVQTNRSAVLRKLIDQGLPFRFTPLAWNGEIQLVLINCDRQGFEAAPAVWVDVVQGVKQRQGLLQLFGIWHRLFKQQLKFQPLLGGIVGGRNGPSQSHRQVIV